MIQIAKCQNPSEIQRLHLLLVDIEVDVEDNEEDQAQTIPKEPKVPAKTIIKCCNRRFTGQLGP